MNDQELYRGREQTLVKHFILRKYLERFAHIVGTFAQSITYVDCFSGPWNVRSEDLRDSSFYIALDELRKARTTLAERGRSLKIRCMFLEKNGDAFAKLHEFAEQVQDAEIKTRNDKLEDSIQEILNFVRDGGHATFPFFFIDPTGWTGFAMNTIAPLLHQRPGEVLINFMTDYIKRFIDHPETQTQESFISLFGSPDVQDRLQRLPDRQDREDTLVSAYAENVKRTGRFNHSCAAIVLYPEIDRSYFHLIYATRDRKGVEVFKHAERQATEIMKQVRAEAKQRKRFKKSGQRELFSAEEMPHSRPIDNLRKRYIAQAKQRAWDIIQAERRVTYERIWDLALAYPLVWDSDLKEWIKEWEVNSSLKIEGMKPRQRVPKLGEANLLVLTEAG